MKNTLKIVRWGIVAAILAFVLKGETLHAAGEVIELDLRDGSIEIEEDRYRQNGNTIGVYKPGKDYIITSGGEETDNVVSVRSGEHRITFSEVHINSRSAGFGVATINQADSAARVYLTIEGKNELQGWNPVVIGAKNVTKVTLTVTEESTGEITVIDNSTSLTNDSAAICVNYGTFEILGGTINTAGGYHSAGIKVAAGSQLKIAGGRVTAAGDDGAAGIGGNYGESCGDILITGGHVEATGGKGPTWTAGSMGTGSGAGIGSGSVAGSDTKDTIQVGTITITGGYVSAKAGGTDAAGIGIGGGGVKPSGELVSDRTGNAWVEADSLMLGAGSGNDGTSKFLSGVLFIGNEGKIYGSSYELNQDAAISQGKKLTIDAGKMLYIPKDHILTLSGGNNIEFAPAAADVQGIICIDSKDCLAGNGNIGTGGNYYLFSDDFEVPQDLKDTGTDQTELVKTRLETSFKNACQASLKGQNFVNPPYVLNIRPSAVNSAGQYTATFTTVPFNRTIEKSFLVYSDDTVVRIEVTAPPDKTSYEHGDNFDPAGMIVTAISKDGSRQDITDEVVITDGTGLKAGQTSVAITYRGVYGEVLECETSITVEKKKIDLSGIEWNEEDTVFEYDGESHSPIFDEELLPEGIEMVVTGTSEEKNAGTYKVTVEFKLKPGYEDQYILGDDGGSSLVTELEWTIKPKDLEWNTSDLEAVGNTRDDDANIYGELGVNGAVDSDVRDGNINTSYPADNITGVHDKVAGENKDIALEWKNEDDKFRLEGSAAGNYNLPEDLPVVSGSVNEVEELELPRELKPEEGTEYRMDLETRISKVPDGLAAEYETPSALEGRLVEEVVKKGIAPGYVMSYDLALLSRGDGDSVWQRVEASAIPSAGLTITMPYPEGITGEKYKGVVAYIYPETINGVEAGTVVYLEVTRTDGGIRFKIPAPAPVAVGWEEIKDPSDNDGDDPGEGENPPGGDGNGDGDGDGNGDGDGGGDGNGDGDGDGDGGGNGSGGGSGDGNGDGSGSGGGDGSGSGGGNGSGGGSGDGSGNGGGSGQGITTGDKTQIGFYTVLAVLAAADILGLIQIRRFGRKRLKTNKKK